MQEGVFVVEGQHIRGKNKSDNEQRKRYVASVLLIHQCKTDLPSFTEEMFLLQSR